MDKKLRQIIFFFMIISCAHSSESKDIPKANLTALQHEKLLEKHNLYLRLSEDNLNEYGWIKDTKCDGLLFNSLYAISGGSTDILLAEDESNPGKFFRSPSHDCYELGQSRSETSRDMYIGLMLWAMVNNRLDIIENIITYGRKHSIGIAWIMGKEKTGIGSVDFRPDFLGTVFQVRYALGGKDEIYRNNFQVYPKCKGFECHIKSLLILLRYMAGKHDKKANDYLREIASRDENNALFHAIYGRINNKQDYIDKAYDTLINGRWFPNDRLPSNFDKCGFYVFERDKSSNSWNSCENDEAKIWSGVDFLFTSALLLNIF